MASTPSEIETITGPGLEGVWIHDPADAEGSIRQFFYAPKGRRESRDVASDLLVFAGRQFPVAEFGESQSQTVDVKLMLPFGDDWASQWQTIQDFYELHTTYCYRDSRGRSMFGVLRSITFNDAAEGTGVIFTFERVTYDRAPFSIMTVTAEDSP